MAERPIFVRSSGRNRCSPAGSPPPKLGSDSRTAITASGLQDRNPLPRKSSPQKPPLTEPVSKQAGTPVSEAKQPVKALRSDSSSKAKHLGYNSDSKPTMVTAKNLWRERLSSSSAGKKQLEEKEFGLDLPKWSRDDPRFKTCDSLTTATNQKASQLSTQQEPCEVTVDWRSQNGSRNQAKKPQFIDNRSGGDRYQLNYSSNMSSKRKEIWTFSKSMVPVTSMGCLDLEGDSHVKTKLFDDSKIGIQTTEELKGMITQQMGRL